MRNTLFRDNFDGLDNSSITCGIKHIHHLLGGPLLHSFQWNRKKLVWPEEILGVCDNVAAVGSGRGCRGVLALQFGAVETSDKFQQVDFANQNATGLYCSYCRTPSAAGKQGEFDCNNDNLQWRRCQPLEIAMEEVSTARNCNGGGVNR